MFAKLAPTEVINPEDTGRAAYHVRTLLMPLSDGRLAPLPDVFAKQVPALNIRKMGGVFVIYYNPVHGYCFDAAVPFSRYFAATLPYAAEELGYGPDENEAVVIWQAGSRLPKHPGANAAIRIKTPDVRAELE